MEEIPITSPSRNPIASFLRPCSLVCGAPAAGAAAAELSIAYSSSSGRTAAILSARRCCQTVSSIIARVNRKIIVAIT